MAARPRHLIKPPNKFVLWMKPSMYDEAEHVFAGTSFQPSIGASLRFAAQLLADESTVLPCRPA